MPRQAYYYFGKEPGAGGLPVGTGGRVLVLLSGGIDSPVAAWRMIRRGCHATFVHFHGHPFTSHASIDKVRELVRVLAPYQLGAHVMFVPFGELQRQITMAVPAPLRVDRLPPPDDAHRRRGWPAPCTPAPWSPATWSARWRRRPSTTWR